MQKYGESLWIAKHEVERYFQGEKPAYYKACGEYQTMSTSIPLLRHTLTEQYRRSIARYTLAWSLGDVQTFN